MCLLFIIAGLICDELVVKPDNGASTASNVVYHNDRVSIICINMVKNVRYDQFIPRDQLEAKGYFYKKDYIPPRTCMPTRTQTLLPTFEPTPIYTLYRTFDVTPLSTPYDTIQQTEHETPVNTPQFTLDVSPIETIHHTIAQTPIFTPENTIAETPYPTTIKAKFITESEEEIKNEKLTFILCMSSAGGIIIIIALVLVIINCYKDQVEEESGSCVEIPEKSYVNEEPNKVENENVLWTTTVMGPTDDPFRDDFLTNANMEYYLI